MPLSFDGSQPGQLVGHYTYAVRDDRWTWSDEMYSLHGFEPGEIPATTQALLSHKHPDDRARAYEVLEDGIRTGNTFSCYHRIIDRHGEVRSVLSVGRGVTAADGTVAKVVGFFIDLTEVSRVETQAGVEAAMARVAEHREEIDQAKGMVMVATGCDADAAFAVLADCSKRTNTKLREVAHRLVEAVGAGRLVGEFSEAALQALVQDWSSSAASPRTPARSA